METVLLKIISDCGGGSSGRYSALRNVAQDAYDILVAQQGNPLSEMHELREKCLAALEQCLEVKGTRFASYGLEGLQLLLRDNQLHSLEGVKEKAEESLPIQVLHTLHSLPDWNQEPDMQCHCLTVILQVICSSSFIVISQTVTTALELCIATFVATRQVSVRMAVRATVSQILTSYCTTLYKEQAEDAADADFHGAFDEVIVLLQFCNHKLTQMANSLEHNPGLLLACDACLAILSAQTQGIQSYEPFITIVWKELCPSLVSLIGNPQDNEGPTGSIGDLAGGRGMSGTSGNQQIFGAPDVAKTVYMICAELLRLVGPVQDMRSVLEALFHRFLLFPPPNKRGEALRVLKKIASSPERIVDLCPPLPPRGKDLDIPSDLSLWKIVLDCLVECSQCSEVQVSVLAVECVDSLLVSMGQLCDETAAIIQPNVVNDFNCRFPTLRAADSESFPYVTGGDSMSKMLPSFGSIDSEEGSGSQPGSPVKSRNLLPSEEKDEEEAGKGVSESDETGKEDMEACMRSVADRIGSALRKYDSQADSKAEDMREHFLKVQTAVSEERRKHNLVAKDDSQKDRERARAFVGALTGKLIEWGNLKSIIELDDAVQRFASDYCRAFMADEELSFQKSGNTHLSFLNADAVYLATFASLRFSHRLNQMKLHSLLCPTSEEAFVSEVLRSGCIVYATESWVKEVHREILSRNLLKSQDTAHSAALINMIEDYDGATGEMLRDVQRLEKARKHLSITMHCSAAQKLCRRLFTASWDGFLVILSSLVEAVRANNRSLLSFLQSLKRKSGSSRHRERALLLADGLSASLGGLQKLAHLCTTLKLQSRSGWIFRKLVEVSCPLDELRALSSKNRHSFGLKQKLKGFPSKQETALGGGGSGGNAWILRMQDVLSMEILISSAAETGSRAPDCWKHLIRCFEYVWELERFLFAEKQDKTGGSGAGKKMEGKMHTPNGDADSQLTFGVFSPTPFQENVSDILAEHQRSKLDTGDLDSSVSDRIVCLLVANIDGFFETVSQCLNMKALEEFCDALITASQDRLFYSLGGGLVENWSLLHRLTMTLIRSCGSGRPLAHLMRIWTHSAAHFIEASCSRDPAVGKKAISCLHECVVSLLNTRGEELEGFHFNESLLLPFQTILCLEMSDAETQDQIVCILAEFVESYPELIHSGWKPLFGALKAVKASGDMERKDLSISQVERLHRTVLDVLEAFLKLENWDVFCLAALDCISCLLNYLQAPSMMDDRADESDDEVSDERETDALYKPALESVRRLHALLASLFRMNRLPVFHLLHRLMLRERSIQSVDSHLVFIHLDRVQSLLGLLEENTFFGDRGFDQFSWLEHETEDVPLSVPWKGLPVTQLAILESWLTLVEGVVSAVVTCPRSLQPHVLEVLNEIMESLLLCPGFEFGSFCLVHLVFPMIQQWERREARFSTGWRENSPSVRNFKQAVGFTAELTVSYLKACPDSDSSARMIRDMCSLLTECVAQPSEIVSRLGCSCLRHVILSSASSLTESGWSTVCKVLWKNIAVTLHPVRMLMLHFLEGSELRFFGTGDNQHYGDIGRVQVALRKDSNPREAQRIRSLAQQVFLLDSQKFVESVEERADLLSYACRSVVLLLHSDSAENSSSLNSDLHTVRLPFRDIVISLLSHQLLLQLIGSLLLEGTQLVISGVSSLLMKQVITPGSRNIGEMKELPGHLSVLKSHHVAALILCLESSFQVAYGFDERPGLKFLIQKVFSSAVAANLYKQAVTAWTVKALTLFELGRRTQLTPREVYGLCRSPRRDSVEVPNWFSHGKSTAEISDECLNIVSKAYLRICRELCKIEPECGGHLEADRVAKNIEQDPFVFLLAEEKKTANAAEDVDSAADKGESESEAVDEGAEEKRDEDEETVYCMATTDTLSAVLAEYKKRKQKNTMPPPASILAPRQNPFGQSLDRADPKVNANEIETEPSMEKEQTESVIKDGEARCLAWAEMSVGTLQLVMAQPASDFRRLLPVVYPAAVHLAAGSGQQRVRQAISDLLYSLEEIYKFLGSE